MARVTKVPKLKFALRYRINNHKVDHIPDFRTPIFHDFFFNGDSTNILKRPFILSKIRNIAEKHDANLNLSVRYRTVILNTGLIRAINHFFDRRWQHFLVILKFHESYKHNF